MSGHVILSHGSNSGPEATKVSALAQVAEALGWRTARPDYRADDALGYAGCVRPRVARLVDVMHGMPGPRVLVGSSMGAFVSGLASLQSACDALFLMALPVAIPGCPVRFDARAGIPGMLVHGWRDEVCAVDDALAFARERRMPTLLLDDGHRLADHVDAIARQFDLFLRSLDA